MQCEYLYIFRMTQVSSRVTSLLTISVGDINTAAVEVFRLQVYIGLPFLPLLLKLLCIICWGVNLYDRQYSRQSLRSFIMYTAVSSGFCSDNRGTQYYRPSSTRRTR